LTIYSLAEVMRGPVADASTRRSTPQTGGDASFSHELDRTAGTPQASAPGSDGRRSDSAASRHNSGPSRNTAADALGLVASPGAMAVIDGKTLYGCADGWTDTPPAASAGAAPAGEELLHFTPEWMPGVTSGTVNENAQPNGTVLLNSKLYATEETARKLAEAVGATPVAVELSGGTGVSAAQWELDFGDGRRLNAGLVADMFLRDPDRALARLHAELV
jgi:hypothetical protein